MRSEGIIAQKGGARWICDVIEGPAVVRGVRLLEACDDFPDTTDAADAGAAAAAAAAAAVAVPRCFDGLITDAVIDEDTFFLGSSVAKSFAVMEDRRGLAVRGVM